MKHYTFLSLSFLTFLAHASWGQSIALQAEDFKPASTNIIGQEYPQVNSQRQVRFRINAPQAQRIRVFNTKREDGYFIAAPAGRGPATAPAVAGARAGGSRGCTGQR